MPTPTQEPYKEAFDDTLKALRSMSDAERVERLKAAGILDAEGKLTERYQSRPNGEGREPQQARG